MKTKKVMAILLVLALALAGVACAGNQTAPQPIAPQPLPETDLIDVPFEEPAGERYEPYEFADEHVSLTVFYDRPLHTHEHIVNLTAVVTNIGQETVVFQVGSGSNRVPDALRVELGPLTALFRPAIQTMDMQHSTLAPGESITFALPFAPYAHVSGEEQFIGLDKDLAFFQQDEEWVPVPIGEYIGQISFSYLTRSEGENEYFIVEGDELFKVEGSFQFILYADEAEPDLCDVDFEEETQPAETEEELAEGEEA